MWIVVLARIEQEDLTCEFGPSPIAVYSDVYRGNYINAGIWSALEPSMAVVCACIPSLRPLCIWTIQGFHRLSSASKCKLPSTAGRVTWQSSRNKISNGMFSQLNEQPDDVKPLGHDVYVHADVRADLESIELAPHGIYVKTEIK
ncbi:MAG: hypothetical protein Q9196_006606, partial [Gyalolechia fulgens]